MRNKNEQMFKITILIERFFKLNSQYCFLFWKNVLFLLGLYQKLLIK